MLLSHYNWPLILITIITLLPFTTKADQQLIKSKPNSSHSHNNKNNDDESDETYVNHDLFNSYSSYAPHEHPVITRGGNGNQQLMRSLFSYDNDDRKSISNPVVKSTVVKNETLQAELIRSYQNYPRAEERRQQYQQQQQEQQKRLHRQLFRYPRSLNFTRNNTRQQYHSGLMDSFKQHEISQNHVFTGKQATSYIQTRPYNRTYAAVAAAGGGRLGGRFTRSLNYTRNNTYAGWQQRYQTVNQFKQHEINQNQQIHHHQKPPSFASRPKIAVGVFNLTRPYNRTYVAVGNFNLTRPYNRTYAAVAAAGGGRLAGRYTRSLNYTRNNTYAGRQQHYQQTVNQFKQHEINQNQQIHHHQKPSSFTVIPATAVGGFNQTRPFNRTYAAVAASGGGRLGGRYARSLNHYTRNNTYAGRQQHYQSVDQFKQHEINHTPVNVAAARGGHGNGTILRNTTRIHQNHSAGVIVNTTWPTTHHRQTLLPQQQPTNFTRIRQNGMFLNRSAIPPPVNIRGQQINFTSTPEQLKKTNMTKPSNNTMKNHTVNHGRLRINETYITFPYTNRWRVNKRSVSNVFLNYLIDNKRSDGKQYGENDTEKKSLLDQKKKNQFTKTVDGSNENVKVLKKHGVLFRGDSIGKTTNKEQLEKLVILSQLGESRLDNDTASAATTVDGAGTTTIATRFTKRHDDDDDDIANTPSSTTKLLEKLTTPLMFGRINVRRVISRDQLEDDTSEDETLNNDKVAANMEEPEDDTVLIRVPPRRIRCRPNQRLALGRCRTVW